MKYARCQQRVRWLVASPRGKRAIAGAAWAVGMSQGMNDGLSGRSARRSGLCLSCKAAGESPVEGVGRSPKAGVAGSNPAGATPSDLVLHPQPIALSVRRGAARGANGRSSPPWPIVSTVARSAGRRKRPRGAIETLPSGVLRARVYAGVDPLSRRRRYLDEIVHTPADAERALTRLLARVDERRQPKTTPP